jgi:hypothetical protein
MELAQKCSLSDQYCEQFRKLISESSVQDGIVQKNLYLPLKKLDVEGTLLCLFKTLLNRLCLGRESSLKVKVS